MMRDFDAMERDQQGYPTTNGLFADHRRTQRGCPAEKASCSSPRALAIPPAVQRLFLGVIDAANRANVSIYTMDAAGLRAESEQAKIRDQVNQAAGLWHQHRLRERRRRRAADQGAREQRGRAAPAIPIAGSGELAQEHRRRCCSRIRTTCARVSSGSRTTFATTTCSATTPANDNYDGRFRKIEVKVKRPGVTVAARKGYFARPRSRRRAGQRVGSAGARRPGAEPTARTAFRSARARCDFPSAIGLASSRSSSNSTRADPRFSRPDGRQDLHV